MKSSIIVPAYNEENRIKPFLNKLIAYCKKNLKSYEIILVNDGSKDNTLEVLNKYKSNIVRVVTYRNNRGKGHAVKEGIFSAKGNNILFIDADGSIPPFEIPHMLKKLDKFDVVVGTRNVKESKVEKTIYRKILSWGFNTYVSILFFMRFTDYLCGFKGMKKSAATKIFRKLISERWLFDVEMFYRIKKAKLSCFELPITWAEKGDSHLRMKTWITFFFQLIFLRIRLLKD